jgi:hypothetical protein
MNRASSDAYAMYHDVPLTAIGASAVAVIRDTIVIGPVDIWGDDQKRAAIITGIKAV